MQRNSQKRDSRLKQIPTFLAKSFWLDGIFSKSFCGIFVLPCFVEKRRQKRHKTKPKTISI
jgi:hypothetical protein